MLLTRFHVIVNLCFISIRISHKLKNLISANPSANDGDHRWLFRHPRAKILRLFKTHIQLFEDKAQVNNLPQRLCGQGGGQVSFSYSRVSCCNFLLIPDKCYLSGNLVDT